MIGYKSICRRLDDTSAKLPKKIQKKWDFIRSLVRTCKRVPENSLDRGIVNSNMNLQSLPVQTRNERTISKVRFPEMIGNPTTIALSNNLLAARNVMMPTRFSEPRLAPTNERKDWGEAYKIMLPKTLSIKLLASNGPLFSSVLVPNISTETIITNPHGFPNNNNSQEYTIEKALQHPGLSSEINGPNQMFLELITDNFALNCSIDNPSLINKKKNH